MLYQWRYLTGSLPQLRRVWKAYSIGVTIDQGNVDHEPAVYVISPQGGLARLYLIQMAYSAITQLGQLLASEVATLLPGHPAVHSSLSYAQVSGISPATSSPLPGAGGGYVTLGPGRPRLYLFFATWDQEVTEPRRPPGRAQRLPVSRGPIRPARAHGDRRGQRRAVGHRAAGPRGHCAAGRCRTRVAIDGSGQVADGYGVQDEPWLVLASAAGKVLWSWDVSISGWLPAASLEQHVQAALHGAATKASRHLAQRNQPSR